MFQYFGYLCTEEAGDNCGRRFVRSQTVGVGRTRDAGFQQSVVAVNSHEDIHDKSDETEVVFRRLARCHQQDAGVGTQRPVVVLTRTVHTLERFFMQQDTETMFAAYLAHQSHDQQVMVVC